MKTPKTPVLALLTAVITVGALASCSTEATSSADGATTVSVDTAAGPVEVPQNPQRVVALDNTSLETLRAFGVEPVALPKPIMPYEGFEDWIADEAILDVGTHREPNLEIVNEAEPDLIIGGYRFAEYTDELGRIAPTLDIAPSDDAEGGYVEALKRQTVALGAIFDREDQAADIVSALDEAETDAADRTTGQSVFLSVVSGGRIDNGAGRIGRIIEPLNLRDVFAGEAGDVHGDSGLAPEAVAAADPEWMIVLDRDAAAGEPGAAPAKSVIDAQEAFARTTFASENQIVYLDPYFYTRESIQAYTETYEQLADAFANAS
ncbi:siderophore ABC transporter substrate-binding protein [Rhodococcoides kroppenstedtii]|uniref:siderophore ABC transporter substrate-binding protein n=1 Tax=Rhodococcoides kroppenstedtii TaxID=293050 RepID=UPI0028ECC698|nr:ABC transporter substrate-binding protein [Rhodococcus kroppenstedtii]